MSQLLQFVEVVYQLRPFMSRLESTNTLQKSISLSIVKVIKYELFTLCFFGFKPASTLAF